MKIRFRYVAFLGIIFTTFIIFYQFIYPAFYQTKILETIITRLEADSRVAEVIVTDARHDTETGLNKTTIKFLEYDTQGKPLEPRYFTFSNNIIQFQSLVIRFEDEFIRDADRMRGKSAYLFWKVFSLDGHKTEEFEITPVNSVPDGYRLSSETSRGEQILWEKFWQFALDPERRESLGIKNAQIEAPGTLFVPGTLYTLKLEHDGGIRIDATPLPSIIRGETVPD
jgi:hypothetical protein